jgi:hypothetical protein
MRSHLGQGILKMKKFAIILAILVTTISTAATAGTLHFDAVGNANVSGYLEFDDTNLVLDGSCESNAYITALELQVTVDQDVINFSLGNVVTSDQTVLISLDNVPMIENGCGNLATNGDWTIGFWPDGWAESPIDGDASLRVEGPGEVDVTYAVQWVAGAAIPVTPVPALDVWSIALLTLLAGLTGMLYIRRFART